MDHRYLIIDAEGAEVGTLILADELPQRVAAPISAGQRGAFHAKCRDVALVEASSMPDVKQQMKDWASECFGHEVSSVNDLTYEEASAVLDELEERLTVGVAAE